jgi:hypothetical protein
MPSYSMFKQKFKKTIADAVYQEITSKTARYYHWFGKENTWQDFLSPFIPSSSTDIPGAPSENFRYELHVRRDIITAKLIKPSDVSYVCRRIDWAFNTVYDMYDDAYETTTGYGYGPAYSGAIRLEDANFYVLTNEYNVYKCIDNNDNSPSTYQPTGTTTEMFETTDGYKWKFMYSIPVSLRNRFLSSTYMPVSTSLKEQFYSSGAISSIAIENGGGGYNPTTTTAVITGDGNKEFNPYLIDSITTTNGGQGFSSTPLITIAPPFLNSIAWSSEGDVPLGSYVSYLNPATLKTNFYFVLSGTKLGTSGPIHTTGTITNGGAQLRYAGTTATAQCTLTGDVIDEVSLIDGGYGYQDTPSVTAAWPLLKDADWQASTAVTLNTKLEHLGNYYEVTTAGTTGTVGPTHTTGAVANGTATLTFLGADWVTLTVVAVGDILKYSGRYYEVTARTGDFKTGATGPIHTAGAVANGNVTLTYLGKDAVLTAVIEKTEAEISLVISPGIDSLYSISIGLTGSKYVEIPTVTIAAPGIGTQAEATASIAGGKVTIINVIVSGNGYTTAPLVTISNPKITFNAATSLNDVTETISYTGHRLVTGDAVVYDNGGGTSVGNLTDGNTYYIIKVNDNSFQLATSLINATNGTYINLTDGIGATHTLTLTSGAATATAILGTGGEIVGYSIDDAGIGYTNANIEIVDTSGSGSGAVLVPDFSIGNVDTLQANVELLAIPGSIEAIKIVEGGAGYGAATASILGDGIGATADVVCSGGKVIKVIVTNPGSGYTWTDVQITGNAGSTGAVVRAIMSPLGGHGSNAIDELNANSIVFYTSISRDKNQGIEINNDYRKVGLVRNFKQFGSNRRFTDDIGSGCVLITGTFNPALLQYDMLLLKEGYKKYRVVDFTDTQILLSVFNNFTVSIGDTLVTDPTEGGSIPNPTVLAQNIIVTSVSERTIDQFSGDFLFFSVREPYSPTSEQIITVRTVLTI